MFNFTKNSLIQQIKQRLEANNVTIVNYTFIGNNCTFYLKDSRIKILGIFFDDAQNLYKVYKNKFFLRSFNKNDVHSFKNFICKLI